MTLEAGRHGWIAVTGEGRPFFFHQTDLRGVSFDQLTIGQTVRFRVGPMIERPRAWDVTLADPHDSRPS